tara:strand:+ start:625 stop:774 length:150 start_codon:yes stop_codon:yes gene_type:complete
MKILNGKYILFNAIYFAALGCFIHLFVKVGMGPKPRNPPKISFPEVSIG